MNVAFFTEMGFTGKVQRNHPNMRTEFAWMCALEADHYNINFNSIVDYYDIGIVIDLNRMQREKTFKIELQTRKDSIFSSLELYVLIDSCIWIAHSTASTVDGKSIRKPSPIFLMIVPLWSLTMGLIKDC